MTAIEMVLHGVRFRREVDGLRIHGPKSLSEVVRSEVARRIEMVRTLPPSGERGKCDTCGDLILPYRGGMCELCEAARQKVIREQT